MKTRSSRKSKLENAVIHGEALETLRSWPAEMIDCVVTSPPYYRQRDYAGETRQLGMESSPEEYLAKLSAIGSELLRVLKPSGSLWLVLGDKFHKGELLGIPWRAALAFVAQGWRLRADCLWHKPNAMPSAAKNRPTVDHEYIFLLTKSNDYFYNADAIREPHVTFSEQSRMKGGRRHFHVRNGTPESGKNGGATNLHDGRWDQAFHPLGRNKRTVWSIPLSKSRAAHFAVFPERLVETCLAAGSPAGGLVLDPFLGSGTTAVVAKRMGRHYLGIECVQDYCEIAEERLAKTAASVE